ncbi:MAG: LamG-like jellyroll fold domain-containing protein, partial [Bacteroidota bacterium]
GNSSNPTFTNTIIYGNTINSGDNQVYLSSDSDPDFYYCIVQDDSSAFTGTGAGANYTGSYMNNIDTIPQFVSPSDSAGTNFDGLAADWSLQPTSPCINAGTPDTTGLNLPAIDLAGNPRIIGDTIDIGPYEYYSTQYSCLVADYPFNGNANDASGNGNNGTVNGATLAPDRFGNANSAYSFNGSNNYISVSQIANLTANQTKCFWIKLEALASNMYIIDEGNNNNWIQLYDDDFDGKLELKTGCVTNGVSIVISNQEFTQTGTWFFVASTLGTDSILKFYINGLLDNSGKLHNIDNPSSIVIGKSGVAGYFFNGIIDDIQIYNCVLDSATIDSLYHIGGWPLAAQHPCLVADYPFNANANDESGNGNNGIVNGATLTTDRFGNADAAYSFDGVDDFIDISCINPSTIDLNTNGLNITSWFQTDDNVQNAWIVHLCFQVKVNINNGIINCAVKTDNDWSPDISFPVNNDWHCVSFNYLKNNKIELFVDGVLRTTLSIANTSLANECWQVSSSIGKYWYSLLPGYDDWFFNGKIDDIKIYNCALDSSEIDSLYHIGGWPTASSCMVADYPFNGNANDASGNGNNGTVNGATLAPDRFGNANSAYSFNGVSSYINVPQSSSVNISGNQISLVAWIKWDGSTNTALYIMDKYSGVYNLALNGGNVGSGRPRFAFSGGASVLDDDLSVSVNEWHLLCASYDGTIAKIYLDNQIVSSQNFSNSISYSASELVIGSYLFNQNLYSFSGDMDDIKIYNCTIDSATIDSLYHVGGWDTDSCNGFVINVDLINNATCGSNNGSAELIITGGTAPFTYLWSNGDTLSTADSLSAGMNFVQITDSLGCFAMEYFTVNSTGGPVVSLNSLTNVLCFGGNTGAIDINISGGVQPYTTEWSNGANTQDLYNITVGNYQVMVTDDNGCMVSLNATITQPPQIIISFNKTNPACMASDGEILANVTGGTPTYSYNWSNSSSLNPVTGLSAGSYYLTITDINGCTKIAGTSLTSNGGPIITPDSIIPEGCGGNGGAIYVSVTGGTLPYASYEWSNGTASEDLINVSPDVYYLTVTDDAGCIAVYSGEIIAIEPLEQPICVVMVDSATGMNLIVWEKVQSSGIDFYKIYRESWYAGQYDCIDTVMYDDMSEYVDPNANPATRSWRYKISSVDFCGNESPLSEHHKTIHLTMNEGLGQTYNLIWDHYEGFPYFTYYIHRYMNATGWLLIDSLPANLTSYTDNPGAMGGLLYKISINTLNACIPTSTVKANGGPYSQSTSNMEDNGIIISISKIEGENIKIYPNPNNGKFTVEIQNFNKPTVISGFDITGNQVFKKVTASSIIDIDIHGIARGIYIFKIANDNQICSFRIIVQ